MAAIDFPNSPTVGTTFISGRNTWIWTGTTWDIVAGSTSESLHPFLLMGA